MKQEQFTSLRSSIQEEYGQIQTLCDIIKAVNEEKHFKSTQEVFDGIAPIMNRYIKRGTIGELTRQRIKAGLLDDESLFRDGQLDCDALREKLLESITTDKDDKYERIMAQRDVFKFVGLLMYFNCFRKYTSLQLNKSVKTFANTYSMRNCLMETLLKAISMTKCSSVILWVDMHILNLPSSGLLNPFGNMCLMRMAFSITRNFRIRWLTNIRSAKRKWDLKLWWMPIILMTDLAIRKSISPIRKNSMGLFW